MKKIIILTLLINKNKLKIKKFLNKFHSGPVQKALPFGKNYF